MERKFGAPEKRKKGVREEAGVIINPQTDILLHTQVVTHTLTCRQTEGLYLYCKVEGKCLISFRQVIIFHSNEDGLSGLSGQQKGCSINSLKVPCVCSL